MVLHDALYTVAKFPDATFFGDNGEQVEHKVKPGDMLKIKVIFNRMVPGRIISYVTTHEQYTCVIKGDIVDHKHDGEHRNIVTAGYEFK